MNLNDAIGAHAQWKTKLRMAISRKEQMDAATISRDDCCELGRWLHGDAKRMGNLAAYREVVQAHADFHKQAGKVAAAINAGKYEDASKMLGNATPYSDASAAVGLALTHLKQAVPA